MNVETFNQEYEEWLSFVSAALSDDERELLNDYIEGEPMWVEPYLSALFNLRQVEHSANIGLARRDHFRLRSQDFEERVLEIDSRLTDVHHVLDGWKRLLVISGGAYALSGDIADWKPADNT